MVEKRVITLDDYEHRVLVRGLNDSRTLALREGKPTEDLDGLLIKVLDAPAKKGRRFGWPCCWPPPWGAGWQGW